MRRALIGIRSGSGLRSGWLALVLSCLLSGAASFGLVYFVASKPPVTAKGVRELDGVAVRGGTLDLLISRAVRTRTCDVRVDRWVWQDSGAIDEDGRKIRRYVTLPDARSPPTPLNVPTSYILSIPLPTNVTAGEWYVWSRAFDGCAPVPAGDAPARESLDTPFLVVERPAAAARPAFEQLLPFPQTPR